MKRFLHTILFLTIVINAAAQVKVTGRVTDLQGKPVSEVVVKLSNDSKTLAFTTTDAQGMYSIELESLAADESVLQFAHISYEKETEKLSLISKVY